MKVLLLSVALLFFTGAQGRHFWQQDEPKQEPAAEEKTLEKIAHDSLAIVTELLQNLDYSSIAEQYHIKERLESAKKNAKKLEKALEKYYEEAFKKFDDQLHEKFPVFRTKVVPKLKEFDDAVEKHLEKLVKEFLPVGSDLVSGISRHIVSFFENLETIAEKGRDNLRIEIDRLRVKLQPYVEDVHAEYEKYRKNVEDKFQKDYKDLKQELEKNMEQINQHAKPHIENLRSKFPDGKEFQDQLEKFLKGVKESLEEQL